MSNGESFFVGMIIGVLGMLFITIATSVNITKNKMEVHLQDLGYIDIVFTETRIDCPIKGTWLISGKEVTYSTAEGQRKLGTICESHTFLETK